MSADPAFCRFRIKFVESDGPASRFSELEIRSWCDLGLFRYRAVVLPTICTLTGVSALLRTRTWCPPQDCGGDAGPLPHLLDEDSVRDVCNISDKPSSLNSPPQGSFTGRPIVKGQHHLLDRHPNVHGQKLDERASTT